MKFLNKFIILFFILILFISMRSNAVSAEFPFGNSKPFDRELVNIIIDSENRGHFDGLFMSAVYDNLIYTEEVSGKITYKFAIFASTGVIQRFLLRSAYFFPESYFELEKNKNAHVRYYSIVPPTHNTPGFSLENLNPLELKFYYETALELLAKNGAIPATIKFMTFMYKKSVDTIPLASQVPSFVLADLGHLSANRRGRLLRALRHAGIRVVKVDIQKNSARCFAYFN